MKSTIKIGRDEFDVPVIHVNRSLDISDLRDETLAKFFERLRYNSNFAYISPTACVDNEFHRYKILPIGELSELIEMRKTLDERIQYLQSTDPCKGAI